MIYQSINKCAFLQVKNCFIHACPIISNLQCSKASETTWQAKNRLRKAYDFWATKRPLALEKAEKSPMQDVSMSQQPLILAVETSGRIGSVAIGLGEKILDDATFSGAIRHTSELFPTVQALLKRFSRKPAQIEQVYISVGPGSFTGLRIGVALAKTMHLANAARIVAVDTLDAIAANASDYAHRRDISLRRIAAVLDAKRGQFYIAAYEHLIAKKKGYKKIMSDSLMTPSEFLHRFACQDVPIWLLGDALLYYKHRFRADGVRTLPEQ
jgi:tRNA threonylcarbamoyladenosine biosynthesis protein TsaB